MAPQEKSVPEAVGLQTDGDLWAVMWEANLIREPEYHDITKVKGHADQEDIEAGRSTHEHMEGNKKADECATKGLQAIGATKTLKWIADRHEAYVQFMHRVQGMIVHVLMAEKEERKRRKETKNFTAGYDEDKKIRADGWIKVCQNFLGESKQLQIQKPSKAAHKFEKRQLTYEDVHRFLADQSWKQSTYQTRASGTTWMELFALFDTGGYRRAEARLRKDDESAKRTDARRAKAKHMKKRKRQVETSERRPSLGEEMACFKKLVKHVVRQDVDKN